MAPGIAPGGASGQAIAMGPFTAAAPAAATETAAIPWPLWCSVLAVTSSMIGVHWDISWHRSIGRDTFLTAPHIAIYLCGVLGGIASAYLILRTTFGPAEGRASSVSVLGFRGPLGAFVLAWGGVAMLTSAPFDDWWHNAYGLDVRIISPPHALLTLGMLAVQIGVLLLVLGYMNRAASDERRALSDLFLYVGGMIVVLLTVFTMERTDRTVMHTGDFYRTICLVIPVILVGVARASDRRWATTLVAAVYTVFLLGLLWVLPRFPAVPKLGPVYYPVTQFIPPPFPFLILPPALALDELRARRSGLAGWTGALIYGIVFLSTYLIVQWPFADFLLAPASRNWVFGTHYFGYNTRAFWHNFRNVFADWETPRQLAVNLATALVAAVVTSRLGLAWGDWMRRIRR